MKIYQLGYFIKPPPIQCSLFSLLEDLVPAEAIVEQEVGERVVEVFPQSDDAVVLVRIGQLLEQDVGLFQGSGQHHALLVVNVVV